MTIELKLEFVIHIEGTTADAQELRNLVEDLVFEALDDSIHCSDPECCPGPPPDPYICGMYGFSTFDELKEDE